MNEDTTMRQTPFDLEQMIAAENDPQRRVLLLLVNTFNANLAANTTAVEGISTKLDNHLTKFEQHMALDDELRNQGKGAWKVLAWVLGGVQVIGLGIWVEAKAEIKDIHASIAIAQRNDATIEARCVAHEARLTALERKP